MKVGDLVQINSAGRNVIWTEPFRQAVGLVVEAQERAYTNGEFRIVWTGVLPADQCSSKFQNNYWWRYKKLIHDIMPRNYLKYARRRK